MAMNLPLRPEVLPIGQGPMAPQQQQQQQQPGMVAPVLARRPGALGGGYGRPQVNQMYRPSTMAQPFDRGYSGTGTSLGFGQRNGALQGAWMRGHRT